MLMASAQRFVDYRLLLANLPSSSPFSLASAGQYQQGLAGTNGDVRERPSLSLSSFAFARRRSPPLDNINSAWLALGRTVSFSLAGASMRPSKDEH